MQLTKETIDTPYLIQSYTEQAVIINGQSYTHSLLLTPNQLHSPWGPTSIQQLTDEHIQSLLTYKPELILLGTGKTLHFPPHALLQPLLDAHVGVEVMDTGAACRTYMLLVSEGRAVVALLLPSYNPTKVGL